MKATVRYAAVLALAFAGALPAASHEIAWLAGVLRIKGVGHCAKGPCQHRAAFETTVPHRHLGGGKCEGTGGSRTGTRFDCPDG